MTFESVGAVEYGYRVSCYDQDALDLNDVTLTCKSDFADAVGYRFAEVEGTTDKGKSTTVFEFADQGMIDKTAHCFVFTSRDRMASSSSARTLVRLSLPRSLRPGRSTEDPDRLVAHIMKPSVEYDDATDTVTVAWSTGPTVTEGSATVSCYSVLLGAEPITCKNLDEATPFGTDNVVYDKTLTKETYESTLDLPLDISSAQCFIEVEGEYGLEKCKEAGEVDIPQTARLLATIVKPSVEADPETNSFEVSWSTLGAVTDGLYEVACYELVDGADPITCKDLPENPTYVAVGEYDKALMKESYDVEFSDAIPYDDVTFQCFIAVEGEYGVEQCKKAGEAVFPPQAP